MLGAMIDYGEARTLMALRACSNIVLRAALSDDAAAAAWGRGLSELDSIRRR